MLFKIFFVSFFAFGYSVFVVMAASDENSLQDQLDAINSKIKSYSGLVNQTQQQRAILDREIKILEANALALQQKMNENKTQIQSLDSEIGGLETKISEKEKLIIGQKDLLKGLMRAYYENTERTKFQLLLSTQESAQLLDQNNWTADTGNKMKELIFIIPK